MHRRRPAPLTVAALATVTILTACSSSTSNASSTTTTRTATSSATSTTRATTVAATPKTCHPAAGFTKGTTTHHLTIAGVDREFLVHMPPHPTAGMRLVVDFHGAGSTMLKQDFYSGFDPVADAHGFVVASPNGIDAAVRQWRYFNKDDENFAKTIVRTLAANACVNAAHAYAVGISSGGGMTATLACQASDVFAGFGPVAADVYIPALCGRARRRPVIIFHGTADAAVPYGGGHIGGPSGLPIAPAETTAAAWAKHNGCRAGITRTRLSSQVVRLTWKGCAVPVVMYRIEGGGHTWPGAIPVPRLGLTTKQISATTAMWKFFTANG